MTVFTWACVIILCVGLLGITRANSLVRFYACVAAICFGAYGALLGVCFLQFDGV